MADLPAEVVSEATGEITQADSRDRAIIFQTQDPERIIDRATVVANRLNDIIEKGKLYNMIQGRKYVRAEGWTAMTAMLGVFPSASWCHRLDRTKEEIAYEAKITLYHISGRQVGCGEALCSSLERNWTGRDEYAIKSMAQTRAVGKACRLSFSWIMALAGYEATPAEEMDGIKPIQYKSAPAEVLLPPEDMAEEVVSQQVEMAAPPAEAQKRLISEKQVKFLWVKMKQAGISDPIFRAHLSSTYGFENSNNLDRREMDEVLAWLAKFEKVVK